MESSGENLKDFFKEKKEGIAFDDFILLPNYGNFSFNEINLETKLTHKIILKTPIISSPMDTVTEELMARSMALFGGIGIIHYNQEIEKQAQMVKNIKRFENGFIDNPLTLSPEELIQEAVNSGYSSIPITKDGRTNGELVGLLTAVDYSIALHANQKIKNRMIPLKKLVFAKISEIKEGNELSLNKANKILLESHIPALPIVDNRGRLNYLVTRKDIEKNETHPLATKDEKKKLRVGAAVNTQTNNRQRIDELIKEGVDVLIIDTASGSTSYVKKTLEYIRKNYGKEIQVIAGNIATKEQARLLINWGADGLRVGVGAGSICTTQETLGIGRAQARAIFECASEARKKGIPIIADGGINNTGKMIKALALGASTLMLGRMLAGADEAPGEIITLEERGLKLKKYRGMGSKEAMTKGGWARYSNEELKQKISEGVSATVYREGPVKELISKYREAIKKGLFSLGAKDIKTLHSFLQRGKIRTEKHSASSQNEAKPHSLPYILNEE